MIAESEVVFARRGTAGLVTLNRPQALNAVTHGMVRALARQLAAWREDDGVSRIIITGAGERAFSAGGDIRALHDLGRAGRHDEALAFWRDEYRLNIAIKDYPKPYVAVIDGIVMGGGVGLSVHGSHRVAGDRYLFAMPEVGIGFFPDVGATFFLPRMPGETGTWCALTGDRLRSADAVATGVATHHVPSARHGELVAALCAGEPVDAVLAALAVAPGPGPLAARRQAIDRLFAADSVEAILGALDMAAAAGGGDADFAGAAAASMRTKSPLSLKLALAQMRRGRSMDFARCMATEFRIVSRIMHGHDFYEGIRAAIIAKDNAPAWRPASLAAVSDAEVERHFAPLAEELA